MIKFSILALGKKIYFPLPGRQKIFYLLSQCPWKSRQNGHCPMVGICIKLWHNKHGLVTLSRYQGLKIMLDCHVRHLEVDADVSDLLVYLGDIGRVVVTLKLWLVLQDSVKVGKVQIEDFRGTCFWQFTAELKWFSFRQKNTTDYTVMN